MAFKFNISFILAINFLIKFNLFACQEANFAKYLGTQVIKVIPKNQEHFDFLHMLEKNPDAIMDDMKDSIKFWFSPTFIHNRAEIQVSPPFIDVIHQKLLDLGMDPIVVIENVGGRILKNKLKVFAVEGINWPESFFTDFHRYQQILNFLNEISDQNQELTSLFNVGTTVEKRNIFGIKIGVNHRYNNKTIIVVEGGTHAREWASQTTALYIIYRLIQDFNYGDKVVTDLLHRYDFYIIPVNNPDGYEYSHKVDRLWRKNRNYVRGSECMGIDLNRNYNFYFDTEGSSRDPCEQAYQGPRPASEPETVAFSRFIMRYKNRILAFISLHTYGQLFMYPWGYGFVKSPNYNELTRVGNIAAQALYALYQTNYTVVPIATNYIAVGSADWAHGVPKIPYVYALEMRDKGNYGFLLPKDEIIPVGKETYAAVKAIANAIVGMRRKRGTNIAERIRRHE